MIKVVHASGGTMVCCGKTITLQPQKAPDPGKENQCPLLRNRQRGSS